MRRIFKFFRRGTADECREEYEFEHILGSGSFAEVYKARCKHDDTDWAIKAIKKSLLSQQDRDALGIEVEILEKVAHPNVVSLRQVFETGEYMYLVMELLKGQDLFDRVVSKEKYSEMEAAMAVQQVAAGLSYCHKLGIAHRDLKPENLMYATPDDDAVLKIVDFGLGKVIGEANVMFTACGTPGYVAPEILRGESYTTKVDIWSLGVILYILLCGFPPFYSENNAVMFDQIKRAAFTFPSPWWDDISADAKDLITKMLVVDPTARYDADDVLSHAWVKSLAAGNDKSLSDAQSGLRKLRLKERLKAGVRAVGALQVLRKRIGQSKSDLLLRGAEAVSAAAKAAESGADAEAAALATVDEDASEAGASASASATEAHD